MAQRKRNDGGPHLDNINSDDDPLKRRVSVDFNVLSSLALHAPSGVVESHYRLTRKTMKRLGINGGKVLNQVERVGTYPNVLDMGLWLDSIERRSRRYRKDRSFLADFHATLESRLPPSVIKGIEKEELA